MTKIELVNLAHTQFKLHQELNNWSFKLNGRLKKTIGRCNPNTLQIELATDILDYPHIIEDTLKHEIAHAIDFVRNGAQAMTINKGHGPTWIGICNEIGAKPEQFISDKSVILNQYEKRYNFKVICNNCNLPSYTKIDITNSDKISIRTCKCGCDDYSLFKKINGKFTFISNKKAT